MTRAKRVVIPLLVAGGLAACIAAAAALRDPVSEEWYLRRLESDDETARRTAVERLGEMRSLRAVPQLVEMLRGETEHQPRLGPAGSALARIGPAAVSLLLEVSLDPDTYVGLTVASVLGEMGPAALPGLFEALEERDESLRLFAHIAFSRMGAPVVPAVEALDHPDGFVRAAAVHLLAMQGQQSMSLVPRLVEALVDEHHSVRAAAAEALGVIASRRKEIIPALMTAGRDESGAVRAAVAEALGSTRSAAVVPAVCEALVDEHAAVRLAAVGSMARLSGETAAQAALPALVSRLGDPDERVRRAAADAVTEYRLSTRGVTALLEEFLGREPPEEQRAAATRALTRLSEGTDSRRRPR